jgi:hypothetical protein
LPFFEGVEDSACDVKERGREVSETLPVAESMAARVWVEVEGRREETDAEATPLSRARRARRRPM